MPDASIKIPIYQLGKRDAYKSVETRPIPGVDGSHLGEHSLTLPARIKMDATPEIASTWLDRVREFGLAAMLKGLREAAGIFRDGDLETGGLVLGPEKYCRLQSLATGVPEILCKQNMNKIYGALQGAEQTLRGHLNSWRGDVPLEDLFEGKEGPGYSRQSIILGGIWPSNSSGVYQLLPPGLALGPVLIKPGSGDVFTPVRIRQACLAAGLPVEAIGIYPGDGDKLSKAIQGVTNRRLIFGGAETVSKYHHDMEVEVHGPGCSKIIIGDDMIDTWEGYLDIIIESVMSGSGRGCIACSAIYAPDSIALRLAEALRDRIGPTPVKPLNDAEAVLSAFSSPTGAEGQLGLMRKFVDYGNGKFVTAPDDRAVQCGTYSVLRPLVAYIPAVPPPGDLSPSRFEIPAPAVLVVNSSGAEVEKVIGSTLVCTAITHDRALLHRLAGGGKISRLNATPIPTTKIQVEGEEPKPLEGLGMPRFMFDVNLGKPQPTY